FRAPLAHELSISLCEDGCDASVKPQDFAYALDYDPYCALRIGRLLQEQHQTIDYRLAFGLRLNRRKETRVGDGLCRLSCENFQKLNVALPKAARTICDVNEADQLLLQTHRHA